MSMEKNMAVSWPSGHYGFGGEDSCVAGERWEKGRENPIWRKKKRKKDGIEIYVWYVYIYLIGASLVAQMVKNLPAMQETWIWSLAREDTLEKGWLPTPVLLPTEFHGQKSLVGYSTWGPKELDTSERLSTAQHITCIDLGINVKISVWVDVRRKF